MTWQRWLAALAAVLAGAAIALGVVALRVTADAGELAWFALVVLTTAPALVLGNVVAGRRPHSLVGPLLATVGLGPTAITAAEAYTSAAARSPGSLPIIDHAVELTSGGWMWLYVPVALLALYFPDGRLPSARWRWVALGLPGVALAFMLMVALSPEAYPAGYTGIGHPFGSHRWAEPVVFALLPVLMALLVAAATSLLRRRRQADETTRAQLKWFAVAGLSAPLTLLLCWTSYLLLGGPDLVTVGLVLMYVGVAAATTIAILRHDLYDVDRVLSSTITYGLVTTALLAVLSLATFLGGTLAGRDSAVVAAAVTAVCAALLLPLRNRLQHHVDQRLYPLRRAALAAIEDLRRRTRAGTARPEELESVLRAALADPALRVGYRVPGGTEIVDAGGTAVPSGPAATPVRSGGDLIGVLRFGRPCPAPLADDLADAAALLVEVVRLRLEVGAALEAAGASRARLLRVGYAERRRLERDLHDGAQQRLVSVGMSLRLAQRRLQTGEVDVDGLLDGTVAELATAVAELRQLAHGLRPSSLDDGLGAALTNLTSTVPMPVELEVRADDALPDELTTTAYYVASEAVANTLKHAGAGSLALSVAQSGGQLRVRVTDDGLGGACVRPGSGLAGLSDRIAALGGSLRVLSPPGGGTTIEAVLPCVS